MSQGSETSLVAQMVKKLFAVWETWFQSLGWGGSPRDWNGNPLQYSCLKNPLNVGAQWPTGYGFTESDMTT